MWSEIKEVIRRVTISTLSARYSLQQWIHKYMMLLNGINCQSIYFLCLHKILLFNETLTYFDERLTFGGLYFLDSQVSVSMGNFICISVTLCDKVLLVTVLRFSYFIFHLLLG